MTEELTVERRGCLILLGGMLTAGAGCQQGGNNSEPTVQQSVAQTKATQWNVYEIAVFLANSGADSTNPSRIEIKGHFTGPQGQAHVVPGFVDGEGVYRIRFAPPSEGVWTYEVTSSVDSVQIQTDSVKIST